MECLAWAASHPDRRAEEMPLRLSSEGFVSLASERQAQAARPSQKTLASSSASTTSVIAA